MHRFLWPQLCLGHLGAHLTPGLGLDLGLYDTRARVRPGVILRLGLGLGLGLALPLALGLAAGVGTGSRLGVGLGVG